MSGTDHFRSYFYEWGGRRQLRHDAAATEDQDPSRQRAEFIKIAGDQQDRSAAGGNICEGLLHEVDGTDVEPAGGLGGQDQPGMRVDLARQDGPLDIAAGE